MNTPHHHRFHGKHHGEPVFICRSKHGIVFHCPHCRCYHIEFGNFVLDLTEQELRTMAEFWRTLDIDYWVQCNAPSVHVRKVLVDMRPLKLKLAFTREEAEEIRSLLAEAVDYITLPLNYAMN